jgi:hypothetical protein
MTQRAKCTSDHSGPREHRPTSVSSAWPENRARRPSAKARSFDGLAIDQSRGSVVSMGSDGALIGGGGAARG